MQLFAQTVIDGLLIGGIYIALATGFSLCYGVMDVVDFAVGEWVMVGAFATYFLQSWLGWDAVAFLPAAFLVCALLGYLMQPLIRRVTGGRRPMPMLMGLVFTFGVAVFLRGLALSAFGFNFRSLQTVFTGNVQLLGTVPTLRLIAFAVGAACALLLIYVLYRTRIGVAVRATAQDRTSAELMGVDVSRLGAWVYAVYAGFTGMAGALLGALFSVHGEMGIRYTIFAFFIVVLAGMGYVPGVILSSLLLGLVQSLTAVYVGGNYTLFALFAALYLVLLIAPRGLLGRGH